MPGGEACKNDPEQLFALQGWLQHCHVDRHSCLVIVGGGALLDMAGFAAATTHRGVRVVRMPTTVLAQNDSGVGVKTAINAFGARTSSAPSRRRSPCSTTTTSSPACRAATASPASPKR